MSSTYHGKVLFRKVDVDKNKPISTAQGVQAMPTFKLYRKGECLETVEGWNEKGVKDMIEKHL